VSPKPLRRSVLCPPNLKGEPYRDPTLDLVVKSKGGRERGGDMNPTRFAIMNATRHPKNLMLLGQRRDDSDDTGTRDYKTLIKEAV